LSKRACPFCIDRDWRGTLRGAMRLWALLLPLLLAPSGVTMAVPMDGNSSQQQFRRLNGEGESTLTLDFLYGPDCPHCLTFLRKGILPLIQAGLPGDRVKLTVLPFVQLENVEIPVKYWDQICMQTNICFYAMAPLCALKVNVPAAVPVDSPVLARGVHFATCNQAKRMASHPSTGTDVTLEMRMAEDAESRLCAQQAGVPYGEIKTCVESGQGTSLVHHPGYRDRILKFEATLKKSGRQMMPYVYLNGDVLRCDIGDAGLDCSGIWTAAAGDKPLASPGSLLHVVCSRLKPQPVACKGVTSQRVKVGPTKQCENCVEVGAFRWQQSSGSHIGPALGLASGAATGVAALGWLAWRRARHRSPGECEAEQATAQAPLKYAVVPC